MVEDVLAGIGLFTVICVLSLLIVVFLRTRIMRRFFDSFAYLTYRSRRDARMYELLARNGYIYYWAAALLIRYKSKEDAQ